MDNSIEIKTAEGTIYDIGKGTITVEAIAGNDRINILQLKNVVHAPKMSANLLSLTVLYDLNFEVLMKPEHGVDILKDSKVSHSRVEFHQNTFASRKMRLA
jgi:hypothetical protein